MISRLNHEGYPDPTVFAAFTNIEAELRQARFRPVVYVCSPYSGDTDASMMNARRYCRFAVGRGYIPLAPHLYFPQFMRLDDDADRDLAGFMSIVLLTKCAELWVFGEVITRDMSAGIARATRRGLPVHYFTEDCEEVSKWRKM